jgi:hypothetical protein
MEKSAAKVLRQSRAQQQKSGEDPEGDYVRITWIEECTNSSDTGKEKEEKASRKRNRTVSDDDSASSSRHLRVAVFVQEQWSADVVFCFVSTSTTATVSFCLARGLKSAYEAIWLWFESATQSFVGKVPLGPTPAELATAVALWTKKDLEHNRNLNSDGVSTVSPKPLVLTFSVPSSLKGSGLDNLSLSVPPVSLMQLCTNMEKERRSSHKKSPRSNTNDDSSSEDQDMADEPLPILKAMQCYIKEAFRINIESFSLVKASSAVASFGCDGRCKPLKMELLMDILRDIQMIALKRYAERMSVEVKSN